MHVLTELTEIALCALHDLVHGDDERKVLVVGQEGQPFANLLYFIDVQVLTLLNEQSIIFFHCFGHFFLDKRLAQSFFGRLDRTTSAWVPQATNKGVVKATVPIWMWLILRVRAILFRVSVLHPFT